MALSMLVAACAYAREDNLAEFGGSSPDKRYSIFVEQADEPGAPIFYVIRDRRSSTEFGRIRSSYQPEPDAPVAADDDFAWRQSHPTWIYWRADSRYVAIDETNHRRMGTLILAELRGGKLRQVPLDCEQLMGTTKRVWERGRLFFAEGGFLPRNRAEVTIIGRQKRKDGSGYEDLECSVTIDMGAEGKVIRVVFPSK